MLRADGVFMVHSRSWHWPAKVSAIALHWIVCACMGAEADSGAFAGSPELPNGQDGAGTLPAASGVAPSQDGNGPRDPIVDGEGNPVDVVPDLKDEEEVLVQFELPSAGERYVYAANPENNSIAVVDSTTLGIQSVEAGDRPTFLQTLAGKDAAIVLNVSSHDATIVRTIGGVSRTSNVDVVKGSNAIAVSPDGRFAVVYFNVDLRSAGVSGSFQDLTVVLLEEGNDRAVGMTVGFRPRAVQFDEESKRAFVVTEDGVTILDIDEIKKKGSHIARTISLGGATEPSTLDVSITPDGKYALARQSGEGILRLAHLDDTGELETLDLTEIFRRAQAQNAAEQGDDSALEDAGVVADEDSGAIIDDPDDEATGDAGDAGTSADAEPDLASQTSSTSTSTSTATANNTSTTGDTTSGPVPFTEITDVDLAPTGEFAMAVFRDRRTVLKVPIPEAFADIDAVSVITVGQEIVGSVNIAPNGERALLYTTALETNERITILDLESEERRVIRLPKSIQAVTIAPDSKSALIAHRKLAGDTRGEELTPDQLIDQSHGYSVLELESGFSKLQLTDAPMGSSTIVPDGSAMFILFNLPSANLREVHRVGLRDFLVRPIVLGSPPVSIGSLPGTNKVFVGQDHPDGRMTFIDWETAEAESVTGFELNSRIRE